MQALQTTRIPAEHVDPDTGEITVKEVQLDITVAIGRLFDMQDHARKLLPTHRIRICMRQPVPTTDRVPLLRRAAPRAAKFGHMMACGTKLCVLCMIRIQARRRKEIRYALTAHLQAGGLAHMMTLTLPHHIGQTAEEVLNNLLRMKRTLFADKTFKATIAELGDGYYVAVLEITYGENGWHPHFHILFFTLKPITPAMEDALKTAWHRAAMARRLPPPSREHGLQIQDASAASAYLAKGIEWEMTGEMNKTRGGRTLFQLLADSLDKGDTRAGQLFVEGHKAMHGRHTYRWGEGTLAHFEIAFMPDSEAAKDTDLAEHWPEWDALTLAEAKTVRNTNTRKTVLQLVANEDRKGLQTLLNRGGPRIS